MAIDKNSPEFVAAFEMVMDAIWERIKEALLEWIQNGGNFPKNEILKELHNVIPSIRTEAVENEREKDAEKDISNVEKNAKCKEIEDIRYASCPKRESDGSYSLKNLKEERQAESTFKVIRYADGTCEFELCDLQGESRQIFKDNQAERMPSAVGIAKGQISADNKIVNIKRGTGIVNGRSVKVIEPLEVEFK